MKNTDNQFLSEERSKIESDFKEKRLTLGKDEIIRGHDAFPEILKNSVTFTSGFLKVFIEKEKKSDTEKVSKDINQSPLLTNNVKVGFIIAKKRIRKAVRRNRLKRLLRESYRINKALFQTSENLRIIFTLNEKGYEYFKEFPDAGIKNIEDGIIKSAEKIKKYLSEK